MREDWDDLQKTFDAQKRLIVTGPTVEGRYSGDYYILYSGYIGVIWG